MARTRRTKTPTMNDVAERAGVSQTTVSFVLNEVEHISIPQETRDRVLEAARSLGYRPNAAAKSLRTQQTHLIGFLTDEIATSPFAGKIIQGAQDTAWAHEKLLLIVNTNGNPRTEQAAVEMMLERQVEGILYAAMYHREVELPRNVHEVNAVIVDGYCADRSLPSVIPDEIGGGYDATSYLIEAGHQRIGFINVDTLESGLPAAIGRFNGYKKALADHDLPFDKALVRHGHGQADDGHRYTRELMQLPNPPTAIFCGTDRTAIGAYEALKEGGLAIPDDVSVIGFDDQRHIAAYLHPPLTTMALPFYEMGQWAITYLLNRTDEEDPGSPVQKVIPCSLIRRESVKRRDFEGQISNPRR